MIIQGIQPGPQVMTKQPELFWGVIASMWIGNLMLVVLNLPLIGIWVTLLRVPYRAAVSGDPAVLLPSASTAINNSVFDMWLMLRLRRARLFLLQARLRAGAASCSASCSGR